MYISIYHRWVRELPYCRSEQWRCATDGRDSERGRASPKDVGDKIARVRDREKDSQTLEDNACIRPTQGLPKMRESDNQNERKGYMAVTFSLF